MPSTLSRKTSRSGLSTTAETNRPYRSATTSTTATTASEMATASNPPRNDTPINTAVRIGRYTAMARSSNTSTERITGVSRLPSRPRSASTFATIPDDEMLVTPPSTVAPTGPQPSASATATPGAALSTMSSTPAGHERRRPVVSSAAEYSRPSSRSSSTTPTSLASVVKSPMLPSGTMPPVPKQTPPIR